MCTPEREGSPPSVQLQRKERRTEDTTKRQKSQNNKPESTNGYVEFMDNAEAERNVVPTHSVLHYHRLFLSRVPPAQSSLLADTTLSLIRGSTLCRKLVLLHRTPRRIERRGGALVVVLRPKSQRIYFLSRGRKEHTEYSGKSTKTTKKKEQQPDRRARSRLSSTHIEAGRRGSWTGWRTSSAARRPACWGNACSARTRTAAVVTP